MERMFDRRRVAVLGVVVAAALVFVRQTYGRPQQKASERQPENVNYAHNSANITIFQEKI